MSRSQVVFKGSGLDLMYHRIQTKYCTVIVLQKTGPKKILQLVPQQPLPWSTSCEAGGEGQAPETGRVQATRCWARKGRAGLRTTTATTTRVTASAAARWRPAPRPSPLPHWSPVQSLGATRSISTSMVCGIIRPMPIWSQKARLKRLVPLRPSFGLR